MTKMRKLRTLKEILEMWPEARFDDDGGLSYSHGGWIAPTMLHHLGGTTSDSSWDERLYAEPKTRKAYAYVDGCGALEWCLPNTEAYNFNEEHPVDYVRMPGFDIIEVES